MQASGEISKHDTNHRNGLNSAAGHGSASPPKASRIGCSLSTIPCHSKQNANPLEIHHPPGKLSPENIKLGIGTVRRGIFQGLALLCENVNDLKEVHAGQYRQVARDGRSWGRSRASVKRGGYSTEKVHRDDISVSQEEKEAVASRYSEGWTSLSPK